MMQHFFDRSAEENHHDRATICNRQKVRTVIPGAMNDHCPFQVLQCLFPVALSLATGNITETNCTYNFYKRQFGK